MAKRREKTLFFTLQTPTMEFAADYDFEKQLDALITGDVDFSAVDDTPDSLFSKISDNGTPLAWTPCPSPTLGASASPTKLPWDLELNDEAGSFLKEQGSPFYMSKPAAAQGLCKSVLPLDEALSNFSQQRTQSPCAPPPSAPPTRAPPTTRAPRAPPRPAPAQKTSRLNIASFNLNRANRPNPHISSILTQERMNRMNWTCEQFNTALRLF